MGDYSYSNQHSSIRRIYQTKEIWYSPATALEDQALNAYSSRCEDVRAGNKWQHLRSIASEGSSLTPKSDKTIENSRASCHSKIFPNGGDISTQICSLATGVNTEDNKSTPSISFRALQRSHAARIVLSNPGMPNYASYLYINNESKRRLTNTLLSHYLKIFNRLDKIILRWKIWFAFCLWKSIPAVKPVKSHVLRANKRRKNCITSFSVKLPIADIVNIWHRWILNRLLRYFIVWKSKIPMRKSVHAVLGKYFDKWNCYYGQHKLARLTAHRFVVLLRPVIMPIISSIRLQVIREWKAVSVSIGRRHKLKIYLRNWKYYKFLIVRKKNFDRLVKGFAALRWYKDRYQLHYWKVSSTIVMKSRRKLMKYAFLNWKLGRKLIKVIMLCSRIGRMLCYWTIWKNMCYGFNRRNKLTIEVPYTPVNMEMSVLGKSSSVRSASPDPKILQSKKSVSPNRSDFHWLEAASVASSAGSFHNWIGQEVKNFPDPFPGVNTPSPSLSLAKLSISAAIPLSTSSRRKSRYDNVKKYR